MDEDRATGLARDLRALARALELGFEGADQVEEVVVDQARGPRREEAVALAVGDDVFDLVLPACELRAQAARCDESVRARRRRLRCYGSGRALALPALRRAAGARRERDPGEPSLLHGDDGQRIQAVQGQRRKVGGREGLVALLGRDPSQRAEAVCGRKVPRARRGTFRRWRVADRHRFDAAGAIDQDADAAAQGVGVLGQLPGQIVRDDVVDRNAAAVETLDAVLLGRRKA